MDFGDQIRAVRAAAKLSREEFSALCDLSVPGLKDIEDGKSSPIQRTRNRIIRSIESLGYELTEHGIEERKKTILILDDYTDVLDDALHALNSGEEILFHRSDDRRSVPEVIKKMKELEKAGIKMRSTICEDNTYILGALDTYRWIPADYFASGEVEVIYADRFVIHVRDNDNPDLNTYFIIKSQQVADVHRKDFEYWWENGKCPNIKT